jgi:DNA repair protein RadC
VLSNPVLAELRLLLDESVETVVVVPFGADATVVARGDSRSVRVTPLQVLRPVVLAGASSFVLVHTHPEGGPPSPDDLAVTRRLVAASAIVGVTLVAHLVLAPEGTWDCLAA